MRAGGITIGLLFQVSGWLLAITALMLLSGLTARILFVGVAVTLQVLGLGLFAFASRAASRTRPNSAGVQHPAGIRSGR